MPRLISGVNPSSYAAGSMREFVVMAGASTQSTGLTTGDIITLDTNIISRNMSVDQANERFVALFPGFYFVGAHHLGESPGSQFHIRKNGNTISGAYVQTNATVTSNDNLSAQRLIGLEVGDYIDFRVNGGEIHENANFNFMWAYMISPLV